MVDNLPLSAILNHMVEDVAELDAVFHALANGARREMLGRLALMFDGEWSMNNVAGKSSSLVRGFRFRVYDVMHKRTLTNSLQPRGHTRGEAVSLRLTVTESGAI